MSSHLLATLLLVSTLSVARGLTVRPPDDATLATVDQATRTALLAQNPWPMKNGNFLRSGQNNQGAEGAHNLSEAAWIFEPEDPIETFYASPVIDHRRNTLVSGASNGVGKVYSVSPTGQLNWVARINQSSPAAPGQMPTPVLFGEQLFIVDGQGTLLSISLTTGVTLWRQKYAFNSGGDSWSVGIHLDSGTLFTVANPTLESSTRCEFGGTFLYAHSWEDGHVKWLYPLRVCTCNIMPFVQGNTVYFSDVEGGLYGLDIASGREAWVRPGYAGGFTTAAAVLGEIESGTGSTGGTVSIVFAPSNEGTNSGVLRAVDLETGGERWNQRHNRSATAGAAVYRDLQGRLLVALGISDNPGPPWPFPALNGQKVFPGSVFAYDALSGELAWEFQTPVWRHQAVAGSTSGRMCLPDAFTNPAVDAAGVLYIGWAGGVVFAINGTTGTLVSRYNLSSGMQGEPGLAENLLVATSCQRMAGFVDIVA